MLLLLSLAFTLALAADDEDTFGGSTSSPALDEDVCTIKGEDGVWRSCADALALKNDGGIPADAIQFTPRERQVVDLIAEGLSNKEIAESLHIATYTVKSHVHNILEKLALSTRLQIAAFVRKGKSG